MMKELAVLMGIYLFMLSPVRILAQPTFEEIRSKWVDKKYQDVIKLGKAYRNTLKGKGMPALDYMILSSVCLTSSDRNKTCKQVKSIVNGYYSSMGPTEQEIMKRGLDRVCQTGEVETNLLANHSHSKQSGRGLKAGVTGHFKTFMLISESLEKEGIFKDMNPNLFSDIYANKESEVSKVPNIESDSETSRINERVSKNDVNGLKKRLVRFGNNPIHLASENFLIIADRSTKLNLSTVSVNLEKVLAFYQSFFKMSAPQDYIVVNLMKDYNAVRPFISRYYNNKIEFEPLGYSSAEDNTIIAWIPASDMIGTLKHELIHVLIKSTFSFIPDWFEEGLATLYEESRFSGDTLKGIENWRGAILKEKFINFPLDSMIMNADYVFTPRQREKMKSDFINYVRRGAFRAGYLRDLYREHEHELGPILDVFLQNYLTHHKDALSRYFVLYLQETGHLQVFYAALLKRDQSILDLEDIKTDQELLCESLNKEIPEMISLDFYNWLDNFKE